MITQTQKKNRTETIDCDPATGCCDPVDTIQVGNEVYTNTHGSSGPSDQMKELLARKDNKIKELRDLKIVQKK